MAEFVEHGAIVFPGGELYKFADSLFGYLYFKLNMRIHRPNTSKHFKEIIGKAVIFIRGITRKFNSDVIDNLGMSVNNTRRLCHHICSYYPNDDYFKKFYYISAFILEVMVWCESSPYEVGYSYGPQLWIAIFQYNFKNEFERHGGWQGLAEAGHRCFEWHSFDILPTETVLPTYFRGILASVRNPTFMELFDQTIMAFENLEIEPMETDAPVDEAAQVETQEEVDENQSGKVEESKEESEENRSQEIDVGAFPHSSALGGDVVHTDTPMEGTSKKSEESTHSRGTRSRQKRRHDTPPNNDSDTEQEPSKAKLDRK